MWPTPTARRAALTRSEAADESSPDWAPDGRSLVVDRDGTLVVVRADGALERRLTAGREPAWSADGKIAFVSDRTGNDELYVVDSTGRGLRQLTTSSAAESAPSWSPDGRRLAFVSADGLAVDLYRAGHRDGLRRPSSRLTRSTKARPPGRPTAGRSPS